MIYKKSKRIYKNEAEILGLKVKENDKGRKQAKYYLTKEQWDRVIALRDERRFVTTQEKFDKNGNIVSSVSKLQDAPREIPNNFELIKISQSKTTGQEWLQYKPKEESIEDIDFDFIDDLVQKYIKPVELKEHTPILTDYFDRLVISDVHVGMTPDENGTSLYGGKWDKEELIKTCDDIIDFVLSKKQGNLLIIDDLGDLVDGWNGETVRKGHKLPQNMNNQKMFDVSVEFKIRLLSGLVNHYKEIQVNNICEDNHGGSFTYIVNSAFKSIIEKMYSNLKVTNHRKFINHYIVGDHAFVISHGKDSHALKFGFKPHLDPKQIEKIDQYCKVYDVYKNSNFVEFSKGDSHQMLFDYCGSDDFDYFNYPALSPSSEWVQTNYKNGRRGFVFFNIDYNENEKVTHTKWL